MILFMKKYLEKRGYKICSEKEFENISKYRTARNELKELTTAYNDLVTFCADNLSVKELAELLNTKNIGLAPGTKRTEVGDIFKENFYIEFKKGK